MTRKSRKEYNKEYQLKNREYNKEYQLKNREHIKEYNKEYCLKNPEYHKDYRLNNKEHIKKTSKKYRLKNKERIKEYRLNNKEQIKEYKKKYRLNNKEKIKEKKKEWYLNNTERIKEYNEKNKSHRNEYERERRRSDPNFRMQANMRSAMSNALAGRHKSQSTMDIISCSIEGLFQHLENCEKWEPWMTRENYGKWDVDHIIAIANWDANCPLQFSLCWDKSNLQPLEHITNIKKGAA